MIKAKEYAKKMKGREKANNNKAHILLYYNLVFQIYNEKLLSCKFEEYRIKSFLLLLEI
jgi:hypothetical protein